MGLKRSLTLFLILVSTGLAAQKVHEIELIHADKFTVDKTTPRGANKLKGKVQLKHQDALMFCDSALLYDNNTLEAFGNVRIVENDSFILKGDSLFYNGESRLARVRGRVMIDNGTSVLTTRKLDYDRENSVGYYTGGGEITSKKERIHLVSTTGRYFSEPRLFHFRKDVVLTHPDYVIRTDTMHYSTDREKTWFFGPTNIDYKDRKIYCEYGWFDQIKDLAEFIDNAEIKSAGQIIRADTIFFNQKTQEGIAKCFVQLIDTNEKIEVRGNLAEFNEQDSTTLVTNQMLMMQDMGGDTFFLVADTLISMLDSARSRIVKAYYHVRYYKTDMQGRCDSLVYLTRDSITHLFRDPVLWSEDNQITADSIYFTMRNSTVDKMYMNRRGFIIAREDSQLFNQIKGRKMIGHFKESELRKVEVFGNGQTVYYPREADNELIGVNETKCSNMIIRIDSSKINNISFFDKPTARLIPSDRMPDTGLQLDDFRWRIAERPGSVMDLVYGTSSVPVKKEKERARSANDPKTLHEGSTETQTPTDAQQSAQPTENGTGGMKGLKKQSPTEGETLSPEAKGED